MDTMAREVSFRARPCHRLVRVKCQGHAEAVERFVQGDVNYDDVLRTQRRQGGHTELEIPDVGPARFRYSLSDRENTSRFWMAKLRREVNAFAHEVVRVASGFPQMVISSSAVRAGYARLVEWEVYRVIEGKSKPQPTREDEPMELDASTYQSGVPELVAAELVRDVVDAKEFDEFCRFNCVTVRNGDRFYRIPRRPHGLIEVWDARTRRAEARLCVVFQDPGMPPSDELVMKYLLAKHQADLLWQVGVKFSPPTGRFETVLPRRWVAD
ncbi:MAG: hypothetical protein NVSMB9_31530 [Isosphaeraceae bacterium]